ncbi:transposase [Limnoglobus roseus]|uniref:Transposase n=1 Tax=Limnoglobus roseus TaxID=2598579 RepID=A0A5C1ADF6_9BACT|nr:transposase [Limnoglobus roseus]QEL15134.1 hypothetical protein PX52LOC_02043 [Limnoglobus roseus]
MGSAKKPVPVRRRYSDDFRATAIAGLAANGGNVERTARALSIPAKTLEQWAKGSRNPVSAQLSGQKKLDLAEAMEQFAHNLMGVSLEKVKNLNIKDLGVTLGIVVDKLLVLNAHMKAEQQEQNVKAKEEEFHCDLSKLYPYELDMLHKIISKTTGNTQVIYPPQPGDPDYDPGLPTDGLDGADEDMGMVTEPAPLSPAAI